jgi:hypothetical protein
VKVQKIPKAKVPQAAKAFGREVRILVAVELATLDVIDSLQFQFLHAVCKSDPVVAKILETYGVDVPC